MFSKIKNWAAPLLLAGVGMGVASCSENFEVAAPYRDVTAVYGLLSMNDSANTHYIRIQKAFLDENTSAVVMSQIPDSSYYRSLRVFMMEMNSSGTVLSTDTLRQVDLSKEPGQFFTSPNLVYRYVKALQPNYRYRLTIFNPETGAEVSGETGVIDTTATAFRINEFSFPQFAISFPRPSNRNAKTFSLNITPPASFESGSDRYFEATLRFRYVDKERSTGVQTDRFVDWNFYAGSRTSSSFRIELVDASLYDFLYNNIGPAPLGIERYIDSCDLFVRMAAESYTRYRSVTTSQGGLTADQIQPNFTNLQGEDVLGLFSTRASRTRLNIPVEEITYDSLRTSTVTKDLNFVGRSDH